MVVEVCHCSYSPCVLVASIQFVDVMSVSEMDMSGGLVTKYRTAEQIQKISRYNPNVRVWLNIVVVKVFLPHQPHPDTCVCCCRSLCLYQNAQMTHQQDLHCLFVKEWKDMINGSTCHRKVQQIRHIIQSDDHLSDRQMEGRHLLVPPLQKGIHLTFVCGRIPRRNKDSLPRFVHVSPYLQISRVQ